jgi:hypothetical protein
MKFLSVGLASKMVGAAAQLSPAGPTPKLTKPQFHPGMMGGSISVFKAPQDMSLVYTDVPTGGSSDSIRAYAAAHNLPVFQFADYPPEKALLLFSWITVPFCVMCLGFLYLDQSIAGQSWFYIYRYLVNNLAPPGPGVGPAPGGSGPMSLILDPMCPMLPFLLPAPFVKAGDHPPPNPNLRLMWGGGVPCDASGLALLPSFLLAV